MIPHRSKRFFWLASALFCAFYLSACAPQAGSSLALKQQLTQMAEQQQEQARQLENLQQQFNDLQLQLAGDNLVTTQIESSISGTSPPASEIRVPLGARQELAALTESASSYLAAFSALASGRFAEAETGFRRFINQFPAHQYSTNARFWLANAQSSQGNLTGAMATYRQLVGDPQAHEKAPAALLRMAQLYRQQNLNAQAEDLLEQLRRRFPNSPEAQHSYRSDESQ